MKISFSGVDDLNFADLTSVSFRMMKAYPTYDVRKD